MNYFPGAAVRAALASRVERCLPRAVWQEVFEQRGGRDVTFEQHELTLLHADLEQPPAGADTARLLNGLRSLAASHSGKTDRSAAPSSLTLFRHPLRALRMALALQNRVQDIRFRTGIYTGPCALGIFEAQGRHWVVVLGPEREHAAALAWNAAAGEVAVCPASRRALDDHLAHEAGDALLTHTYDGGSLVRATVTLWPTAETPAPERNHAC